MYIYIYSQKGPTREHHLGGGFHSFNTGGCLDQHLDQHQQGGRFPSDAAIKTIETS